MTKPGRPLAVAGEAPALAVGAGTVRGAVTWFAYLLLGYFTYLVSIQGNILPFLKAELDLSYRVASLHTSVIALGLIVVGLLGDRFSARVGWRSAIRVGVVGSIGAMLFLCAAAAPWASIASCALFGLFGGLLPMTVNAVLAELHGAERRDIAFTEANAVAYAFAIMAPILCGLAVWLGLGWRGAILCGAAAGLATIVWFARTPLPEIDRRAAVDRGSLSASFWLHAAALAFAVALEFSILLWAPAYLEQVVGLPTATAAVGAAAFFAGMLVGRVGGTWLVHVVPARRLVFGTFATTLAGFAAYWASGEIVLAVLGLVVLGLGVALTFPLLLGFAIGAAGSAGRRAASRLMLPPALAILLSPPLLGTLADGLGLGLAQLMTPVFAVLMLACFLAGESLRR